MNEESALPLPISAFLRDARLASPQIINGLAHCFRVFEDMGIFPDVEPYGDAFLYTYLTDGPHDIGDRVRRSLSSRQIIQIINRSRTAAFRRATNPQYFSVKNLAELKTHLATGVVEPSVLERNQNLLPFLLPITSRATRSFDSESREAFGISLEQLAACSELYAKFIGRFFAADSALQLPGRYVLIVTDDGNAFHADLIQTLLSGNVVETIGAAPIRSTVSFSWRRDSSSIVQGLLAEFEALINSTTAREADFQRFFERHPEFLLLLGHYDEVRSQVSVRVEGAVSPLVQSTTYRPDFFLHEYITNRWDFLDIKRPHYSTPLLVGTGASAHSALMPSAVLRKALGQMREYRRAFDQIDARNLIRQQHGMNLFEPRCILLMGKEANFPTLGSFESVDAIRDVASASGVDLITYDQLLRIVKHRGL